MEQAAFLPGAGGHSQGQHCVRPPQIFCLEYNRGQELYFMEAEVCHLVRQNLFMWKDTENQDFSFIYSL